MAKETQEINKTLDHLEFDKIGSVNLEDAQVLKSVSETLHEDANIRKSLKKLFQDRTEDVGNPKTLGKYEIPDAPVFDHLGKPLINDPESEKTGSSNLEDSKLLKYLSEPDELDDMLMTSIDADNDEVRFEFESTEDTLNDASWGRSNRRSHSADKKRVRAFSFRDENPFMGYGNRKFHDFLGNETKSSQFSNDPDLFSVGAGLANMGNTCFMNAILQCFIHCVPIVQGILSVKHEQSSHDGEFCVLCAVRCQIELSLTRSGRVISPSNLVNNLSYVSSFIQRYQQEDAHEFLQCLLDKLDSNWSKYEGNEKNSSSNDSLVKQIFGGRIVSQVCCCKCGHNSDTCESFIDLSLEIENVDNLETALQSFTKVESIEDTEKFTCEGCKDQVQVEKQLLLDKVPSVVALHLKRFKSDGNLIEKNDKKVYYPLELDLMPYRKGATDGNKDLEYELFGVVVHVGVSFTSGHYFCYIRTAPNTWYRFDDAKVTRVLEASALSQEAYILFYARKGTEYFSSFFDKWKALSEQKNPTTSPMSVIRDTDLPSTSSCIGLSLDDYEPARNKTSEASSSGHMDHDFDSQFSLGKKISGETCSSLRVDKTIEIDTCTPPRSKSPDLHCDEEPADKSSTAKKTMDNAENDSKRKETIRYMSKSMPSDKRQSDIC